MNPDLIKLWVGSAVRWVLGIASGFLVKAGFVAADKTDSTEAIVTGIVLAAIALAWSAVQKYIFHKTP